MYTGDFYQMSESHKQAYLFEDNEGNLLTNEQLDELSYWEIEDRQIRVFEI